MAESDFDRKIEVITDILADLTVKHQLAEERMNQWEAHAGTWEERMDRADRRMSRVENVLKLAIRAGRRERREWREKCAALVDAQMRTESKLARNEETVGRLADAQTHADKRLDALIDIVREDRERRNGRARRDDTADGGVDGKG